MTTFINSFRSEWMKKKRSLASWLVLVGAFFTPSIILLVRLKNSSVLAAAHQSDDFWKKLWTQSWESMAIMLLPLGIMLATGLVTQLEFKNNAWKQLHATPQQYSVIFFAKLAVILIMLVEVFALFNLGIYLSGVIPALVYRGVPYPQAPIPYELFLADNVKFYIDCLPILTLQYVISLHFKNFLVPLGVGFVLLVLGIGLISWEYSYIFPYIQCGLDFFVTHGQIPARNLPFNIQWLAMIYTAVFTIAGYVVYVTKNEKG